LWQQGAQASQQQEEEAAVRSVFTKSAQLESFGV